MRPDESPTDPNADPHHHGFLRYCLAWCLAAPGFRWILLAAVGIPLFYAEENWRGKRAWEHFKQEQRAHGLELDWTIRPLPSIPASSNFYAAPGMKELFVRSGAGWGPSWIRPGTPPSLPLNRYAKVVIEIVPFDPREEPAPGNADLLLAYDPPVLRLWRPAADQPPPGPRAKPVIPLILMDDVPLLDAVRNLARQAGDNYLLDPSIGGEAAPLPNVTLRWENVTAHQALLALLQNHGLAWMPDAQSGIARIVRRDPSQPLITLGKGVRRRLEELVRERFGPIACGSQGILLFGRPWEDIPPVRVAIRSGVPLSAKEAQCLLAPPEADSGGAVLSGLHLQPAPKQSFFVEVSASKACTLSNYLAWSAWFDGDYEQIRRALERPYALPPGDYRQPAGMPIENFVALRTVCQNLAQRAQCRLLAGQPDEALKDLALIHQLCRILHGPPTDRPTTLVSAMIYVALAGLHAGVVADGLHWQAWREPQLAALQAQLESVDLCPSVARAFTNEVVYTCSLLEQAAAGPVNQMPWFGRRTPGLFDCLQNPAFLLATFAPRGWYYRNLIQVATIQQRLNAVYDTSGRFVVPRKVAEVHQDLEAALKRFSLYTVLASFAVPNFVRARHLAACNQTRVNQLALACALERFRLARGRYPDSLEPLVPDFIHALPPDPINGHPLHYSRMPEDGYQLYSVGWDEKDDGGTPAPTSSWGYPETRGDWVWRSTY